MAEFLRCVRHSGATDTSPVAAREAVATGVATTESLRADGRPVTGRRVEPAVASWFANGQG